MNENANKNEKNIHIECKSDTVPIKLTYFLIRKIFGPIVRLIWVKKVVGLENIPKKGPVLVAFNHQSYFDFIFIIKRFLRNTKLNYILNTLYIKENKKDGNVALPSSIYFMLPIISFAL